MKSLFEQPNHPLYATIRFIVLMVVVMFSLWVFATEFDETEMKAAGTIAAFVVALFGGESGLRALFGKGSTNPDPEETDDEPAV